MPAPPIKPSLAGSEYEKMDNPTIDITQPQFLSSRDSEIVYVSKEVYRINDTTARISVNDYIEQLFGPFDRERAARNRARRMYQDRHNYLDPQQNEEYVLSTWNVDVTFGRTVHDIIGCVLRRKSLNDQDLCESAMKKIKKEEIKEEVKVESVKREDSTASGSGGPLSDITNCGIGKPIVKKEENDPDETPSTSDPDLVDHDQKVVIKIEKSDEVVSDSTAIDCVIKQEAKEENNTDGEPAESLLPDNVDIIKQEVKQEKLEPQAATASGSSPPKRKLPSDPDVPKSEVTDEMVMEIIQIKLNEADDLVRTSAEPDLDDETMDEFMEHCVPQFTRRLLRTKTPIRELMTLIGPYTVCATNYMIWDDDINDFSIAGTIDCLLWKNFDRREVIVVDWTTKQNLDYPLTVKIRKSPFYQKNVTKLQKCFCHLHLFSFILEKYYSVTVAEIWVAQIDSSLEVFKGKSYRTCVCTP